MFEARQGKEIVARLTNRIGLVFDIFKLISEKGVGILAACGGISGRRRRHSLGHGRQPSGD